MADDVSSGVLLFCFGLELAAICSSFFLRPRRLYMKSDSGAIGASTTVGGFSFGVFLLFFRCSVCKNLQTKQIYIYKI